MEELKIIIRQDKSRNSNSISILINDNLIPNIKNFKLDFNDDRVIFDGNEKNIDRSGKQIDELQPINILNYLNPFFVNKKIINSYEKIIDFDLENILLTSFVNAKKIIDKLIS